MKYHNHCLLLLLSVVLFFQKITAQDSITIKDAEEIRYKSESLIKRELNDLLNNIANTDIDLGDTKKIIYNSHSGTKNQIFLSSKVLLEDDINPGFHSTNNSRDVEVEKYLNDFDLLYKKSDAPSVSFNDVKASNVKKSNNLYIKVYFTSFFRNANKTSDVAYTLNNRVAELRIEKENGKWVAYIARVAFFNPADTANDISNDIILIREKNASHNMTATDSASVMKEQLSIEMQQKEKARQEAIAEDIHETQAFNNLISRGDKALDGNDFTGALKFYKDAKEMRPYDPLPGSKINITNKARERATITADQLFTQYIQKAINAENKREYQNAISFYNEAIAQKPDKASEYDAKKRELTEKFRITSELDEKYKAGLYKEAIKEYDAAIKKTKDNSDLFLGRAKCYEKINDLPRAMKDYNDSYEIDPNNLETIQRRAALYKRNGDYFKSLTDYKTYLTIYKDNTDVYQDMADLRMLINKNYDEAIKDLNDGIEIDPKAIKLYQKKGLLLLEKNDYHAADNIFSTVIKLDSNNALAYYYRGKCQLLLNNAATAGVDFTVAHNKGLDEANLKNIQNYASAYFDRSLVKFNQSAKDSAISLADYAIAINPRNSVYRFNRGEYYFSESNYKEAINNYDEALALDKNYTDALYKRGLAWYLLNDYKAAIENYNSAIKLNAQILLPQKGLADAFLALGEYKKAIDNFENFLQKTNAGRLATNATTIAEAYNGLGKSYLGTNNYEKALAAFKNAVSKNTSYPEALYNRGFALYKTGTLPDGISDMQKAISSEKNHSSWYFNLGRAYQDKKDYQNAIVNYSNCNRLDSFAKIPEAIYYRGYSNYQLQNYSAALADYSKVYAHMKSSNAVNINNDMGNTFLNLDKYDSAYDYYNKACIKDTNNGVALYGIACVLFLKGKTDDALVWFEKSFRTREIDYNDIKKDKLIAALRDDKRFKNLVKKYY